MDDWQSILQSPPFLRRARFLLVETIAFLLFSAQFKARQLLTSRSFDTESNQNLVRNLFFFFALDIRNVLKLILTIKGLAEPLSSHNNPLFYIFYPLNT